MGVLHFWLIVLGFVVSPEEGSSFLPKCSVLFWVFLWWCKKFL